MALKFTRLYASDTVATSGTRKFRKLVSTLESGGQIITFTVEGTTYQAESGMTWEEWVESEYNTVGAYLSYNASFGLDSGLFGIGFPDEGGIVVPNAGWVLSTECIEAGVAYELHKMHGGGSNN